MEKNLKKETVSTEYANKMTMKNNTDKVVVCLNFNNKRHYAKVGKSPVKIGRSSSNHITLKDPAVSSNHCILFLDDHLHLTIQDLNSTNGTVLNNSRINGARRLYTSDEVQVGSLTISLDPMRLSRDQLSTHTRQDKANKTQAINLPSDLNAGPNAEKTMVATIPPSAKRLKSSESGENKNRNNLADRIKKDREQKENATVVRKIIDLLKK